MNLNLISNINYSVMVWLICDFLPFYAYARTCSPSYIQTRNKRQKSISKQYVSGC